MKKPVTIRDVAREADVSPAMVSSVLNGRPSRVSDATRQRIVEAASRLKYRPNPVAAALRNRRTRTIGVLVTKIVNPFYVSVLRGIYDAARQAGYLILVGNSDDDPASERDMLETFAAQRVDGVIVVPTGGAAERIQQLRDAGIAMVLVDRGDPALGISTIRVDNEAASLEAIRYLLGLGHRKVAMIGGMITGMPTRAGRLVGYRTAMAEAGLPILPGYEQIVVTSVDHGRIACHRLLALPDPPTAIFLANTFLALGALEALHLAGKRVPQDISVIVFDDPDWARMTPPGITAIAQPSLEIGQRAFHTVREQIGADSAAAPVDLVLPTQLVRRGSCAPPPLMGGMPQST